MKHPAVEVVWDDAKTSVGGWITLAEALEFGSSPHLVRSVGILLKRTRREIVVSGSLHEGMVGELTRIPAGMVRRVRTLR